MIEALETPLAPILGEEVGGWFADLHRDEGVRVLTGAMLEGARGNGRVEELVLAGGERLACDAVVVGVGTAPATGWLRGSGLDETGVRTDTSGRTSAARRLRRRRRLGPLRPPLRRPRPHRALGRRRLAGRRRGQGDARRVPGHAAAAQLLERPVRAADPVRRPRPPRRRASSSRATPASATSRPSSPAAASRSPASRSAARARSRP